jgi:group I intron endonuclease
MHRNLGKSKKYKYPIYNAMKKYGINNFTFEIIETYLKEDEALKAEIDLIAYFKCIGTELYNITNGGEGSFGRKHSSETKEKISNSNKGNKSRLGQTNSTEHRRKISDAQKDIPYTKERKIKWYKSYYNNSMPNGLVGTEKIYNLKSLSHHGKNNKLSENQVREIKILLKNGLSNRLISKMFNVSKSAIGDISSGRCWSHILIP